MTDNYLELTPDEAVTVFTASGDFVHQLRSFCDSSVFFTMPPVMQEIMLHALERHVNLYEKVSLYLEKNGIPALQIFELDTKVNKPRGGI
jgi:hypothetical protein